MAVFFYDSIHPEGGAYVKKELGGNASEDDDLPPAKKVKMDIIDNDEDEEEEMNVEKYYYLKIGCNFNLYLMDKKMGGVGLGFHLHCPKTKEEWIHFIIKHLIHDLELDPGVMLYSLDIMEQRLCQQLGVKMPLDDHLAMDRQTICELCRDIKVLYCRV